MHTCSLGTCSSYPWNKNKDFSYFELVKVLVYIRSSDEQFNEEKEYLLNQIREL